MSPALRPGLRNPVWGEGTFEIDGEERRPRVAKAYEVLAFLLAQPDRAAERDQLLGVLFDGRGDDSTRAYLRQAIASIRTMLPEGALRTSAVGRVELSDTLEVSSASALLESALVEASRLQSEDRLAALTPIMDRLSTGEYLTGISLGLGGGSETTLRRPSDGRAA